MKVELEDAYERLLREPGVVFLLGEIDTGKSTAGIELVRGAVAAGVPSAYVDCDVGQSTIGPPTTVGLKLCTGLAQVNRDTLRDADELSFVGSISPRGHLLPLVTGAGKLTWRAREAGCKLIVVDTTGYVSGLYGQILKYSKLDLTRPDFVLAFRRGGELEPLLGIAERFTPAQVLEVEASAHAVPRSVEERMAFREQQFAAYFAAGVSRFRVRPTVFMPSLPPEFDLSLLDSLVVGMEDGKGRCVGIGVLEHDPEDDVLRMISRAGEGVRGLRLGSVRIETNGRSRGPVDIRQLFGSE